jgi:hypothetical protein
VVFEGLEGIDVGEAGGGVVGAEEVGLDGGDGGDEEGGAAAAGAAVEGVAGVGDALHAEDASAGAAAAYGFYANLIAYHALVFLAFGGTLEETLRGQDLPLHGADSFIIITKYTITYNRLGSGLLAHIKMETNGREETDGGWWGEGGTETSIFLEILLVM